MQASVGKPTKSEVWLSGTVLLPEEMSRSVLNIRISRGTAIQECVQ